MLRTQKRQIQVYVRLDTVDTTVVAVLPELEVIRKTRRFVVFGKPEHIVLQAFQIEFLIAEALVEIHTRAVAGFFDGAAERDCVFRELDRVHAVGPGLGLDVLPRYMECFDMSNISGTLAVGSMVLFRDGRPSTSEYRRYRIRTPEATDDTAFMREVLTRRYGRLLREGLPLPDLVVLDGGAPQVGCAIGVWEELGLKIPFIGLAKQYELVVIPHHPEPLELPRDNPGLRLLQAIRDEAHRWANGYNRQLRITRIKESVLGEIPGVGERRQAAILKACGSVKRILELTPSQLAAKVPGLGPVLAKSVIETLKQHAAPPRPGTTL